MGAAPSPTDREDIAKWIEMASYTLAVHYDPALDARIDELIARIAKAQRPDGYFNTYFIRREPAITQRPVGPRLPSRPTTG